jgi:hypothetical protein
VPSRLWSAVRRHWFLAAVVALALAYAWPMQGAGNAQNSQYALVRALADGTPRIDRTRYETGDIVSADVTFYRGHVYSNKAPGLAFVSLPAFEAVRAAGLWPGGDPSRTLWVLGLFAVVVPAVILAALVRGVAERLVPGYGALAAVVAGLGTLILPFATIYYNHLLAALLAFAAFAVLVAERQGPSRRSLVFAGGILGGLAVTVEYANALIVGVLAVYALARGSYARRLLAYGAGLLVGLVPLFAYDQWAFGSIARVSYLVGSEGTANAEQTHLDPSLLVLLRNLVSSTGLVTLAPVLACAVAGAVLLFRRAPAETCVVSAVVALMVLYASSFGPSFGGYSPGPRYVVPALPFAALPIAVAFRRFPVTTGVLALASVVMMAAITATHVLAAYDGRWFHRLADRQVVTTPASLVGVTGAFTVLVFFAACAAAVIFAAKSTSPIRLRVRDALCASIAVAGWLLLAAAAPTATEAARYGKFALPGLAALLIGGALIAAARSPGEVGGSEPSKVRVQPTSSTSNTSSPISPSSR